MTTPATTNETRRPVRAPLQWWLSVLLKPLLLLGAGVLLIALLGLVQRLGWLEGHAEDASPHAAADASADRLYVCPMLCTPPLKAPGRCPVCQMKLVPGTSNEGPRDRLGVRVDPVARRVANIRTVEATAVPVARTIRAVGEITYDEASLSTIAAYVDGRIEKMYADYTGMVVEQGDALALIYSPELYAAQNELLQSRQLRDNAAGSTLKNLKTSNNRLYESAREKLLELGMTAQQLAALEESSQGSRRLRLHAPIHGTVIEKLAVEGDYVSGGKPIYKLADLSTVWLMLRVFPQDAAALRYGTQVKAQVKGSPGKQFPGRIAFIDPQVDSRTRTVGVRVVVENPAGELRIGDYAEAQIEIPISRNGTAPSPLVVPREAVLAAGDTSVVYVETEPGRFEIRPVVLGPRLDQGIVILEGLEPGESVAATGNFLIDSQMQLAGNPSLIDPSHAQPARSGPLDLETPTVEFLAGMAGQELEALYEAYLAIQSTLAADQVLSKAQVDAFQTTARGLAESNEVPARLRTKLRQLANQAVTLQSDDLAKTRTKFKRVSKNIIHLAAECRGERAAAPLVHVYCSMVPDGEGDWLQRNEEIANPYWGSEMLRCGKKIHTFSSKPPLGNSASAENPEATSIR